MEQPVVRLRVVFEDRHILSKAQRSEGLKRSWLLLRPDLTNVSDLVFHLSRSFDLQQSCPHGLVLSMDDFVLPPFVSTCIFKDKEIIRVKKKEAKLTHGMQIGADEYGINDAMRQPKSLQEEATGCKSPNKEDADEYATFNGSALFDETGLKRKRAHSDKPKDGEVEENCKRIMHQPHVSACLKKPPSRSARRKKAKRQWQKSQSKEHSYWEATTGSTCGISVRGQILNQEVNGELKVIHTVVRPCHNCFGPVENGPSTGWEQIKHATEEQSEILKADGWGEWPKKGGFKNHKDCSRIINSWLNGAWGESFSDIPNQDGWGAQSTNDTFRRTPPRACRARRGRALLPKVASGKMDNWKIGKFGPSK